MIVTVTPQQAAHLLTRVRESQTAQQTLSHELALVCLGYDVPPTATLQSINPTTGALTFADPPEPPGG